MKEYEKAPYELTLYHYWRSSCSWRVRLALEYKKIPYKFVPVDLLDGSVDGAEHLTRNPMGTVPALNIHHIPSGKSFFLIESLAIIQWLEDNFPNSECSIFRNNNSNITFELQTERAMANALAEIINADTQPLQNLTPLDLHSQDPAEKKKWAQFFIRKGLQAFEKYSNECNSFLNTPKDSLYSIGTQVSIADFCLIPQCYNAIRFEVSLDETPRIKKIYERFLEKDFCIKAHPDRFQPK